MKYTTFLASAFALAVAGCTMTDTLTETTVDAKRDMAKAVIVPIVTQTELPGGATLSHDIAVLMTDCIVDNATDAELDALAGAAVTGATADTSYMVSNILSRSSTTTCATGALTGLSGT